MNPLDPMGAWRALTDVGRVAVAGATVIILIAVWWFVLGRPAHDAKAAADAKAGGILAGAAAGSAKDAVGIVVDNQHTGAAIDAKTQETINAIRQAPEDQRNAVALCGLCLSDAARNDPACIQLRKSCPR